jgi:CO/xanthine dehydrogenase FAD-binding subunit
VIIEYHRPSSLDEALRLLVRKDPTTLPMGGGSILTRPSSKKFAVVDLQQLDLDRITRRGSQVEVGATVTLQVLHETCSDENLTFGKALLKVIEHEANYNQRQQATVAGTLLSAGGRSPLNTAFLALDAQLSLLPGDETVSLGDLLPVAVDKMPGRLITKIILPQKTQLAYEYVARTPADLPIVCAALARWPSGRTRLALGGFGDYPVLAMDGPEADGMLVAAADAYSSAGDQWAGAEYRQAIASVLAKRCLASFAH